MAFSEQTPIRIENLPHPPPTQASAHILGCSLLPEASSSGCTFSRPCAIRLVQSHRCLLHLTPDCAALLWWPTSSWVHVWHPARLYPTSNTLNPLRACGQRSYHQGKEAVQRQRSCKGCSASLVGRRGACGRSLETRGDTQRSKASTGQRTRRKG